MERIRKPFQGIINVVRFNWHFYLLAFLLACLFLVGGSFQQNLFYKYILIFFSTVVFITTLISLLVSWYIYDLSDLYRLNWLNVIINETKGNMANIHAGFDETSILLNQKFESCNLQVFDFYNPALHTAISIKRARKAFSAYPGTIKINTSLLPVTKSSFKNIFLILAGHEIRNTKERIKMLEQLSKALDSNGKIIVTEHLRDVPNFLAYTIGFFHFLTLKEWKLTFAGANLSVASTFKITPFITTFILKKNADAS